MKISELIDALIEIEEEHGEVDVELIEKDGYVVISVLGEESEYYH